MTARRQPRPRAARPPAPAHRYPRTIAAGAVCWLLCGGLFALPATTVAQARAGAVTRLPVVVATATRADDDPLDVPAAIDVIDGREIQRAQPKINLSESLQRVPGVVARDRQNFAQDQQISIRGFGARASFGVRGIRLYSDGIPASMPDGQGQVAHFPLDSAARIEVLRGPFSALYGNSSGGVIALYTADAPAQPLLRGEWMAGAYGLRRAAVSAQAPWGADGDGSLLFDRVDLDTDGYRRHGAAHRRSGQATLKGSFAGSGRYTVLANGLDLDAQDPQGLGRRDLPGDRRAAGRGALAFDTRKTVRQNQLGAHFEQQVSTRHGWSLTPYAGQRRTTQMLSVPVAVQAGSTLHGGGAIDLDRDYFGIDGRWRWSGQLHGRPFALTVGIEHQVSDERRRGYENFLGSRLGVFGALRRDERDRVTGQDVYLQADWQPAERWRLNAGLRRSTVRFASRDDFITAGNPDDSGRLAYAHSSPVLGLLFHARPWLSVYANAGGGFETPTFAELAYRGDGGSGLNRSLRPARSDNVELGLRARRSARAYSAALFHSRTRDELVVLSNQGGRSVFGNAGRSRRRGLELAYSEAWSTRWHLAATYTWLDAAYLSDVGSCGSPPCAPDSLLIARGRRIPGLSRHFAWAEVRFSPRAGLDLMLEGRFVDRVFANDANSAAAPAYAALDLAVERRFVAAGLDWRGFARLNNVLDRAIIGSVIVNDSNARYFEPAPGRTWLLGLSVGKSIP